MRLKSLMTSRQITLRLQQIILDMQAADERMLAKIEFDTISTGEMRALAATLLTGDTQYIRTTGETEDQAALAPDWGSWIEGQSLTTSVLSNRSLLIDLLPLDIEDFSQVYRCTVGQFVAIVKWFANNGKRIHINLRNIDPCDLSSFEAYANKVDSIGLILQEIEDNSIFYCLPARRHLIFSLSDGNRPHDQQRLSRIFTEETARVSEIFPDLLKAYTLRSPDPGDWSADDLLLRGAEVRSGSLIDPRQFAWRLAYYRSYREIFSEIRESSIDQILTHHPLKPAETAELSRLVTLFHHRFTAPITGAFGGTYNLKMTEYGPMMTDIESRYTREHVHGLQSHKAFTDAETQIWDWIATEGVRLEGKKLTNCVSTPWAFRQRQKVVQDETVEYILNQAKPITDEIHAHRDDLITAIRSSVLSQKTKKTSVLLDAKAYAEALEKSDSSDLLGEIEKAVERANCIAGPISSSIAIGLGTAIGIPGLNAKDTLATFGISADGLGKFLEETVKDPTKSNLATWVANRLGKTSARMQIVSVMRDVSALQTRRF